jgi:hypothetical protein
VALMSEAAVWTLAGQELTLWGCAGLQRSRCLANLLAPSDLVLDGFPDELRHLVLTDQCLDPLPEISLQALLWPSCLAPVSPSDALYSVSDNWSNHCS